MALPRFPASPAPQAQPCGRSRPRSRCSVAPQTIPWHSRGTNGPGWELGPHPSLCCWEISSCFPLWPELCLSRGISVLGVLLPSAGCGTRASLCPLPAASPGCPELAAACRAGRIFPCVLVALSAQPKGNPVGCCWFRSGFVLRWWCHAQGSRVFITGGQLYPETWCLLQSALQELVFWSVEELRINFV